MNEDPTPEEIARAVTQAADLVRHAASFLAGVSGMTDRASIRRMRTCAIDIVEALGADPDALE